MYLVNKVKLVVKNKVFYYVLSRYATYFIQFVNSLFIAVYLGPYYLGIWGFINLFIQYITQFNLGITSSVNVIVSVYKNKKEYAEKVVRTALSMFIFLSILIISLFVITNALGFRIGDKYSFNDYAPLVLMIAISGYFNSLFLDVFRIYGKLFEIAFSQSIFQILILLIFLFSQIKGIDLLWALLIANCVAVFFSLLLFVIKSPIKIKPLFVWRLAKLIQYRGIFLFLYSSSFYFIIISTRSFVSAYYTVKEFGYFTFAFSFTSAILLLLDSVSFLIFPKMINRFALYNNQQIFALLKRLRNIYITFSHLFIHIAILLFPLLILFFPKYESSSEAFKLIALAVVIYTNSFGYQGLLIAKKEEKNLGKLAFVALLFNISLSIILVKLVHVPFFMAVFTIMLTYFIYTYMLVAFGRKKLHLHVNFVSVLKDFFPLRLFLPYILSLILILYSMPNPYFILPLVLFIILNKKELLKGKGLVNTIIANPDFINI